MLFFMFTAPAMAAGSQQFENGQLVTSAQGNNSSQEIPPGKIIIKGKGGKVTDVEQKPDRDHEKKKDKKKD